MTSYPRDLIAPIHEHISELVARKEKGDPLAWPFPLPDDQVLASLLECLYHASFQTEEGRRPGFRVLFTDVPQTSMSRSIYSGIQYGRMIPFDSARPFTSPEITRLAPAAELDRFLICVRQSADRNGLEISGLLDIGDNWYRWIRHEVSRGISPPNALTITSVAPGELSLSAAGEIFLVLKSGSILRPWASALYRGPIADHLAAARDALYREVVEKLECHVYSKDDNDYPQRFYTQFLERILHNVRLRAHGGTILLIPDHLAANDTRLADRVTPKYACMCDHAWGALVGRLQNHRTFYDQYFPLAHGDRTVSTADFNRHNRLLSESDEIDAAIADIAQSIAALTAVDGALLMTTRFRVYGFGAEVVCASPSLTKVRVADSDSSLPISAFGTRHRAAFRFCSTFEDAIAFVVSQDGGVKAVKRVGADVVLWPDINGGGFGL